MDTPQTLPRYHRRRKRRPVTPARVEAIMRFPPHPSLDGQLDSPVVRAWRGW